VAAFNTIGCSLVHRNLRLSRHNRTLWLDSIRLLTILDCACSGSPDDDSKVVTTTAEALSVQATAVAIHTENAVLAAQLISTSVANTEAAQPATATIEPTQVSTQAPLPTIELPTATVAPTVEAPSPTIFYVVVTSVPTSPLPPTPVPPTGFPPTARPPTAIPPTAVLPTAIPLAPSQANEDGVVITTIFYDGVVPRAESDEYAGVPNQSSAAVDLTSWHLNAGDPG